MRLSPTKPNGTNSKADDTDRSILTRAEQPGPLGPAKVPAVASHLPQRPGVLAQCHLGASTGPAARRSQAAAGQARPGPGHPSAQLLGLSQGAWTPPGAGPPCSSVPSAEAHHLFCPVLPSAPRAGEDKHDIARSSSKVGLFFGFIFLLL